MVKPRDILAYEEKAQSRLEELEDLYLLKMN